MEAVLSSAKAAALDRGDAGFAFRWSHLLVVRSASKPVGARMGLHGKQGYPLPDAQGEAQERMRGGGVRDGACLRAEGRLPMIIPSEEDSEAGRGHEHGEK